MSSDSAVGRGERGAVRGRGLIALASFAALMLMPVTLPVPVLRGLVQERFEVSEFLTSLFMSVNMIGALLTAPLAGVLADRTRRHKGPLIGALVVDAVCLWAMTGEMPFVVFMGIRLIEGCAHITALSLLLSLAGEVARRGSRGRVMGAVGSGITLGVAMGAPIGGKLGRVDVLLPLQVGALVLVAVAVLAALFLRDERPSGVRPGLRQIIGLARRETALLVPYTFAFVDRFTVGFFTTTFTLYLKRVHDLPVDRIGMLLGLFLGPFFLLSYPVGRLSERVSRGLLLAGGSLVYGFGVMTLGLWSMSALPVLMVTLGVLSAVMFVPSLIMVTDLAKPEIRSTALGGFNSAGSLGFVVGPIVGGGVSQWVGESSGWQAGYAVAFAVAGLAEIACVLLTWRSMRRMMRTGRTT